MKRFKFSLLLLFFTVFLISCTTSKDPVVGTWECFKIRPLQEAPQTTNTAPKLIDDATVKMDDKGPIPSTDPILLQLLDTYPDISKIIRIKDNKTVSLFSKNNNISGTWDMNRKANSLDIKLKKTKKVIQFKFTDPKQERFSVYEKFNYGEFEVSYQKKIK